MDGRPQALRPRHQDMRFHPCPLTLSPFSLDLTLRIYLMPTFSPRVRCLPSLTPQPMHPVKARIIIQAATSRAIALTIPFCKGLGLGWRLVLTWLDQVMLQACCSIHSSMTAYGIFCSADSSTCISAFSCLDPPVMYIWPARCFQTCTNWSSPRPTRDVSRTRSWP